MPSTSNKPAAKGKSRRKACYRYPNDKKEKTRGELRYPPKKPACERKLGTPRTRKDAGYNPWDSTTARRKLGTMKKRRVVLTTRRNARKKQY